MDERPVGVFDSGFGGLTCVRELIKLMPGEDIIYFGDTARVPYGSKTRETIIKYTRQDTAFLLSKNVKHIVVACGTASSNALGEVRAGCPVCMTGVVEMGARGAASATKNGKIGIIATEATIKSGSFEKAVLEILPDANAFSAACPLFVPLVENGRIDKNDKIVSILTQEYLHPLREKGIDTLLLGCTHYPLLTDAISAFMGENVTLVDPGRETAHYLRNLLLQNGTASQKRHGGQQKYYVSDSSEAFMNRSGLFLEHEITGGVEKIDIEAY